MCLNLHPGTVLLWTPSDHPMWNALEWGIWLKRTIPLMQVPEAEVKAELFLLTLNKVVDRGYFFFFLLLPTCSDGVKWGSALRPSISSIHSGTLIKVYADSCLRKMPRILLCKPVLILPCHASIQQRCNHGAHTANRDINITLMTFIN